MSKKISLIKMVDGYYVCNGCGKQIKRGGVNWFPWNKKPPTHAFHGSCLKKFEVNNGTN